MSYVIQDLKAFMKRHPFAVYDERGHLDSRFTNLMAAESHAKWVGGVVVLEGSAEAAR